MDGTKNPHTIFAADLRPLILSQRWPDHLPVGARGILRGGRGLPAHAPQLAGRGARGDQAVLHQPDGSHRPYPPRPRKMPRQHGEVSALAFRARARLMPLRSDNIGRLGSEFRLPSIFFKKPVFSRVVIPKLPRIFLSYLLPPTSFRDCLKHSMRPQQDTHAQPDGQFSSLTRPRRQMSRSPCGNHLRRKPRSGSSTLTVG